MNPFPRRYFHPSLPPRDVATKKELIDLLVTDDRWRYKAYTASDLARLRAELDKAQEQEHAANLDKARYQAALQVLQAKVGEDAQIIEGYQYRRAIVIYPGQPMAHVYPLHKDKRLHWRHSVPVEDVLPDGAIVPPEPPQMLMGWYPSLHPTPHQPAALDLTDKEWHTLPPPDTTLTSAPDDGPQPASASLLKSDTTGRRGPGRQPGSGDFVGHEIELIEHVIKLVKQWRINAKEKGPPLKENPSLNDIRMPTSWGRISSSSFPNPPSPSTLYKCLKVYGQAIGQPTIIWDRFLASIKS